MTASTSESQLGPQSLVRPGPEAAVEIVIAESSVFCDSSVALLRLQRTVLQRLSYKERLRAAARLRA